MLLIDNLLLAPGKAMFFLLEELVRKAQEEWLDDDSVKRELQEIYALFESGKLSDQEFEAREYHLVERLQQIAKAKFQERADAVPGRVIDALPESVTAALPELPAATPEPPPALPELPPTSPNDVGVPPPTPDSIPVIIGHVAAQPDAREPDPAAVPAIGPAMLTMNQVIESAMRGLAMLKLRVSSVTSVGREDNGWRVTVELVERRGVPDTSDLLGVYELHLDEAGNLLRYDRTRIRRRCDLSR